MSDDTEDDGLHIDWRRGLIPLSLLVLFVLRFGFGAPMWLLVSLTLWIPLYFIAYPMFLRWRWEDFEQEFAVQFQRGNLEALLEDYQSRWFLRKFGPKTEMLEKLGLIYSAMEKYREAEHVFERALDASGNGERDKLFFNLANVKYELGKYEDAEEIYRTLNSHGRSPYRHSIETQLALIDLHRGRDVQEARQYLEEARDRATGLMKSRIDRALG